MPDTAALRPAADGTLGARVQGVSHVLCATVGAGCLALPSSWAWTGWLGGACSLLLFAAFSFLAAHLQLALYEKDARRNGSYRDAALALLGLRWRKAVTVCQTVNIVAVDVAYTITAAIALKEVVGHVCAADPTICAHHTWPYVLYFGAAQLLLSQVPRPRHSLVPALGAATALGYCCIAAALSIIHLLQGGGSGGGPSGGGHGDLLGWQTSPANKAFGVLSSIGALAFAFSCSAILLEIMDTLRSSPRRQQTMTSVINASFVVTLVAYLLVAVTGYLSLGNMAAGRNILAAFEGPRWLVILGNVLVLLHMLTGYQVFARACFVSVEQHACYTWLGFPQPCARVSSGFQCSTSVGGPGKVGPISLSVTASSDGRAVRQPQLGDVEEGRSGSSITGVGIVGGSIMSGGGGSAAVISLPSPFLASAEAVMRTISLKEEAEALQPPDVHSSPAPLWLRLVTRSLYVLGTTALALVVPDFTSFLGLVGGLTFWPLTIGFPLAMWLALHRPGGWRRRGLVAGAGVLLLACLAAVVGSMRDMVVAWGSWSYA